MKSLSNVTRVLLVAASFVFAQVSFAAGAKTLIELDGGKPKAGMAKSWKKVKDGEYEFDLDPAAEVKKGTKVTAAMVKTSIEGKLGSGGVKVTEKSASKVLVSYTGPENKFLESVSKTKIRGGGDVELALESSTSEGGIRADIPDRDPEADEVKAIVNKTSGGIVTATVNASKSSKVAKTGSIKVKITDKGLVKNAYFFFKPGTKAGDVWVPVAGSVQVIKKK